MNLNTLHRWAQHLFGSMEQLINPPFCAVCKQFNIPHGALLCQTCSAKIQPIVSYDVVLSSTYTMTVFALSAYQEPLKSLVLAKMYGDIAISAELGTLLWQQSYIRHVHPDIWVPVPLHWRRYAARGYNQAHEMAKTLSAESGCAVRELVRRKKHTKIQAGLSADGRHENLAGAFELAAGVDHAAYRDKHIVLVDDLYTTGATLKQAARVLMQLKPKRISALVVCRVV